MSWPAEKRRPDLEPEQMRPEYYLCEDHSHALEQHRTQAAWLHRYGPEAHQALCTDCVLRRLLDTEQVVRLWSHSVRKLGR